ncbi:MAG: hypothetical protein ACI4SB_08140 [Acutalibacteraceae bacterium]
MKLSNNRLLVIRHIIFAVMLVLAAVLQQTDFFFSSVGSARLLLLVPLTVAIAMHERSLPALFFGLFAGLLWDGASVTVDGFYAALLCATGFGCSVVVILKMRNNILSCLLLSFSALTVSVTLYWLMFFVLKDYGSSYYVYMKYYFSSVLYSMIFVPLIYYFVRAVVRVTSPERKRINY